jgi:hypothetical protein
MFKSDAMWRGVVLISVVSVTSFFGVGFLQCKDMLHAAFAAAELRWWFFTDIK